MNTYVIKYLAGGYGSHGIVIEDYRYANTHEEALDSFWNRYDHILDCVKPVVLGMYLREPGDTKCIWEKRKFELTDKQTYGH